MFGYESSQNNLAKMNYIEYDLLSCSVAEFLCGFKLANITFGDLQ